MEKFLNTNLICVDVAVRLNYIGVGGMDLVAISYIERSLELDIIVFQFVSGRPSTMSNPRPRKGVRSDDRLCNGVLWLFLY